MDIHESILECIGNTPMVRLNRITKDVSANIMVKCEFLNPSGSMKDRIALKMIEGAEKEGKLKEGGVVTESSTGNTATANDPEKDHESDVGRQKQPRPAM